MTIELVENNDKEGINNMIEFVSKLTGLILYKDRAIYVTYNDEQIIVITSKYQDHQTVSGTKIMFFIEKGKKLSRSELREKYEEFKNTNQMVVIYG